LIGLVVEKLEKMGTEVLDGRVLAKLGAIAVNFDFSEKLQSLT
jgi:hypothetical protein